MNKDLFAYANLTLPQLIELLKRAEHFAGEGQYAQYRVVACLGTAGRWFLMAAALRVVPGSATPAGMRRRVDFGDAILLELAFELSAISSTTDLLTVLNSWQASIAETSESRVYGDMVHLNRVSSFSPFGIEPCITGSVLDVGVRNNYFFRQDGPFLSRAEDLLFRNVGEMAAFWTGVPGYAGINQPSGSIWLQISDIRAHFASGTRTEDTVSVSIDGLLTAPLFCSWFSQPGGERGTVPVVDRVAKFALPPASTALELFLMDENGLWYDKVTESASERKPTFDMLGFAQERQARGELDLEEAIALFPATGWTSVDRNILRVRAALRAEADTIDYQTIGLVCRETLIDLAQAVYDPSFHTADGGQPISNTDAKAMLDGYFLFTLPGEHNEGQRRHARAALSLANDLTHSRKADSRQAALCIEATTSVVNIVAITAGRRSIGQETRQRAPRPKGLDGV